MVRRSRFSCSSLIVALVCGAALSGCSTPAERGADAARAAAPAASAAPGASTPGLGTIAGKTAPAPGVLIVVLEARDERTLPPQTEAPVMDQVGLAFGPELLIVRTGEPVEFRNSDDTLHNVHVTHEETREPAFNVAIPTGNSYRHTLTRDGFYRVGCDIHPAMAASVFAASTPFTTIADAEGRFTFADVPPGAWRIAVYAAGKRRQKDVDVTGGTTEVSVP